MTDNTPPPPPPQQSEVAKTTWLKPSLFGGRFTRKQYFLRMLLVSIIAGIVNITLQLILVILPKIEDSVLVISSLESLQQQLVLVGLLTSIPTMFLFCLPFGIKRAHDIGHKGTFLIALMVISLILQLLASVSWEISTNLSYILLIPALIYGCILLFKDSERGTNAYGTSTKYPNSGLQQPSSLTMTEDKNIPTDEITYTPMLSKFFPSFSGTCTKEEFRESCIKGIVVAVLYCGLMDLVVFFFSDYLYLSITLMLLLTVPFLYCYIKIALPPLARRCHSFGMSFTCWIAIPVTATIVLYVLCCISKDDRLIVLFFLLLIYVGWIFSKLLFQDSPTDKKQTALSKKIELIVSSQKKGKKITPLKKQQTNQTLKKVASIDKTKLPNI